MSQPDEFNTQRELIERLAQDCQRETLRYTQGDKNYDQQPCFEIWRLAVVEQNAIAWEKLYSQYHSFVRRWLQIRLQTLPELRAEEEILLNGAFINFFRFVGPDKFSNFKSLPQLLQYLKMICGTVVADAMRDRQAHAKTISLQAGSLGDDNEDQSDLSPASRLASDQNVEREAMSQQRRTAFYLELWKYLPDERDRMLVQLRFVQDIPPRKIAQLYPQFFATEKDIYRRLKNLLWRLNNNPTLREQLEDLL